MSDLMLLLVQLACTKQVIDGFVVLGDKVSVGS